MSSPSRSGHPRLDPHDEPSLRQMSIDGDVAQRNRWTRRILLGIAAVLALATLLSGIRW